MKKKMLSILLSALLAANICACNHIPSDRAEHTVEGNENPPVTADTEAKPTDSVHSPSQGQSIVFILNDILQKQYTWSDFSALYPQYQITAQSNTAMNIVVPEFENVVFVFSGDLNTDISSYQMASVNAGGDILLPEHFGKTFDQIIAEESDHASYVLSDDIIPRSYKYEYVYIYRNDFYYFIRGYRHSNELTADHIAMFQYDENHKRPW